MTPTELERSIADAALLGPRVAWWLVREAYGWSALDELIYYAKIPNRSARCVPDLSWHPPTDRWEF